VLSAKRPREAYDEMRAILTYHSIDPSGSVVSVHPDRFRRHMEILSDSRVPVVSIAELVDPVRETGVAITFDDGFENLATVAWPLLREHGFSATVFIASSWVGRDNGWDPDDARIPRLPLMDWSTLAALAREGLRLGSHSRSHPRLTTLADAALVDELEGSRAAIREETDIDPRVFAYPYGDHDERVDRAVGAAGYTHAVTSELRLLEPTDEPGLTLPRLDAYYLAKPGVMERWGTGSFRRYVMFRHAARRVRARLHRIGVGA
jgi:peptidoglycan/xylan/chitin deacetylase (PgdA/CDA1 family)